VCVVCYQVEVSASGRSLVQRSPTECGVSECDREASKVKRPWPTRGCGTMKIVGTYMSYLRVRVFESVSGSHFPSV